MYCVFFLLFSTFRSTTMCDNGSEYVIYERARFSLHFSFQSILTVLPVFALSICLCVAVLKSTSLYSPLYHRKFFKCHAFHSIHCLKQTKKYLTLTHSNYSIGLTEIMKFASKCNAVNTQISKSFREYSIDILFNDCKSKQKCPILYNVGPK